MKIIPVATDEQIQQVADLASEIWTQHFTPIIGAAQVKYMLETVQSAQTISDTIRSQGHCYHLIYEDNDTIGYFAYALENKRVFLSKLYLRAASRGKGYAKQVLDYLEAIGRTHQATEIWLTVNKNNTDVINIYRKMSFHIEGPVVQDIGSGFVMDDYKMVKPLTP